MDKAGRRLEKEKVMESDAVLDVNPLKPQRPDKAAPSGTPHERLGVAFGPLQSEPPFRFPLRRGPHFRSSGRSRSLSQNPMVDPAALLPCASRRSGLNLQMLCRLHSVSAKQACRLFRFSPYRRYRNVRLPCDRPHPWRLRSPFTLQLLKNQR